MAIVPCQNMLCEIYQCLDERDRSNCATISKEAYKDLNKWHEHYFLRTLDHPYWQQLKKADRYNNVSSNSHITQILGKASAMQKIQYFLQNCHRKENTAHIPLTNSTYSELQHFPEGHAHRQAAIAHWAILTQDHSLLMTVKPRWLSKADMSDLATTCFENSRDFFPQFAAWAGKALTLKMILDLAFKTIETALRANNGWIKIEGKIADYITEPLDILFSLGVIFNSDDIMNFTAKFSPVAFVDLKAAAVENEIIQIVCLHLFNTLSKKQIEAVFLETALSKSPEKYSFLSKIISYYCFIDCTTISKATYKEVILHALKERDERMLGMLRKGVRAIDNELYALTMRSEVRTNITNDLEQEGEIQIFSEEKEDESSSCSIS